MDDSVEPLPSFASSSTLSNGSINHDLSSTSSSKTSPCLEALSLNKLSFHLEQLLPDSCFDYSDATIIVDGVSVGVHRCILAARSRFFHELFKQKMASDENEGKPKYCLSDLLPYGKISYEVFSILLSYLYTAKLKPLPLEASTCVNSECTHEACRPAIDFAVELMYASSIFQVSELVSLFQRHIQSFVEKARTEDVIPILVVAFHCQLNRLLAPSVERVAQSALDSISIGKELPQEVAKRIRLLRCKTALQDEHQRVPADPLREKRIRSVHQALDLDDIELVKLLLNESDITLDDANALHYAVAYCDPKVVFEVLGLSLADVNLRNARGYTVLHVAAMRREPSVIMSLLNKGSCVSELTSDGRTAVTICRSLTRPKDYNEKVNRGEKTNKNRICIDILEKEMQRNLVAQDVDDNSQAIEEDLYSRLLNLENRVALARLFFPTEAKLAMDIAHAETTSEFTGLSAFKVSSGNLKVNLNETPIMQNQRLHSRLEALKKTVETGRRFFPHCSEVLDKFIGDDHRDLLILDNGTAEEQKIKRKRYMELKGDFLKAFSKDKAEFDCGGFSPSPSSSLSSQKYGVKNHRFKKKSIN